MVFSSTSGPTLLTLLGVAVVTLFLAYSRPVTTRAATAAVRDIPAGEPRSESAVATRRWWTRRLTAIAVGIAVGTSGSALYVWWIGADRRGPAVDLLVLGAAAGAAFGCSWVGLGRRRATAAGPRVAHVQRATLADTTPTWLRTAAWVSVCGAATLGVLSAVVTATSPRFGGFSPAPSPSLLLLVLGASALVAFELLGRILVGRPSIASNEAQLVSNDVVRWLAVRDLATTTMGLGLASIALSIADVIMNLDVSLVPGLGLSLPWLAASAGAAFLAAAVLYPLWSRGPTFATSALADGSAPVVSSHR
ncbi:hypothetical protein [Agreia sp. VKM Ac-1783]|uniref:hypothetical protein n=1 Tax=Agreia sp. VKM Ac-1783 TaxID=1938889 RepID=UPI000A2AE705|nr:hypothetical protein [Agreia sp. VKM Ac-1783]SMQ74962.1 hypothetical protein SAMN06295943_3362 [Agreia sp. VKM Ac-1783]